MYFVPLEEQQLSNKYLSQLESNSTFTLQIYTGFMSIISPQKPQDF